MQQPVPTCKPETQAKCKRYKIGQCRACAVKETRPNAPRPMANGAKQTSARLANATDVSPQTSKP